jgi:hypothetical protein
MIGGVEVLSLSVQPSNATIKGVTWTNSNPAVVSVSNGLVTGLAIGSATITVTTTDGGKTASVTVPVVAGSTPKPPIDAATPVFITLPPSSVKYLQNAPAEPLTVVAYSIDGGTLTYQWYRNTSRSLIGATIIQSATTSSYTPSTATPDTVYYYALVTNNNSRATGSKTATLVCPFVEIIVGVPIITVSIGFGGTISIMGDDGYNDLSKSGADGKPSTLNLSATGYDGVRWYIDGNIGEAAAVGSQITIDAADYDIRTHSVTFTGFKNGVLYSQELPFTVIQ